MMCDVMPTIIEDGSGDRDSTYCGDEANFEQLMVNMLDERDKLMETLRETQDNLSMSQSKLHETERERDALQSQLQTTTTAPVGSSREALVSEPEVMTDRTNTSQTKKKKKKRKSTTSSGQNTLGLAAELADLEEDVVPESDDQEHTTQLKWTSAPTMKSEPLNKVFVEKPSGFKSKDRLKLERKRAEQEVLRQEAPQERPNRDTMYFALGTHTVFRTMCVFLQGLLAGFALWHVSSSWALSNFGWLDFLTYYHDMALPVSCVYYFMFALCTLAVLDRYDIGRPTRRLFTRCCTFQSGGIAIVIYFIGIIFTTATTHLDDKIGLYTNKTGDENYGLWDDPQEARSDINTWRILNLMRGLMAMLGWLVVSLRPQTDRLTKNLRALDDNMFGDEEYLAHLDQISTDK